MPPMPVYYFPVTAEEQALLLRVREPDLVARLAHLPDMLDLLASEQISVAELELALQLLAASRQGEGMDARFENLEARLIHRIDRGLSEIEGRLSRRLSESTPPPAELQPPAVTHSMTSIERGTAPEQYTWTENDEVPRNANIAFRIGGDLVWGPSAAQFYIALWRWLIQHQQVRASDLPIRAGRLRYVVAAQPLHPSGKEFTRAEVPSDGFYIEVNLSRGDILRRAAKLLSDRGITHEIIVGDAL